MANEKSHPIGENPPASDSEVADGGEASILREKRHQTVARIAQGLRDAGRHIVIVNPVPAEASALWWDRIVISLALILLTALAWTYLLWLPSGMGYMMPALTPWRSTKFAFVFAMWAAMMVGMMTPSAAPMIVTYAKLGRCTGAQNKTLVATGWFGVGYFLAWAAFSLLATLVQWALEIPQWQARAMSWERSCS